MVRQGAGPGVMGHQDHRDPAPQRQDGVLHPGRRGAVQVRRGFVEQEHRGARPDTRQPAGQCHAAQLPRAQFGGVFGGQVAGGSRGQALTGRRCIGFRRPGTVRRSGPAGQVQQDFVEDRRLHHDGMLRNPRDAATRRSRRAGR